GQQKIAHLVAPEVVDQRVPVRVKTLAGILMLVQCRAVEAHETVFVRWEMSRHPVQDNAQARRMAGIHECGKAGGSAVAGSRCKKPQGLIPPRAAERVLDRKSTRLNSSHVKISYAVFCLKKKTFEHGQLIAVAVPEEP